MEKITVTKIKIREEKNEDNKIENETHKKKTGNDNRKTTIALYPFLHYISSCRIARQCCGFFFLPPDEAFWVFE